MQARSNEGLNKTRRYTQSLPKTTPVSIMVSWSILRHPGARLRSALGHKYQKPVRPRIH